VVLAMKLILTQVPEANTINFTSMTYSFEYKK